MSGRKWQKWEQEILLEFFSNSRTEDIAELLCRSYRSVALHASVEMGIKKSDEYLQQMQTETSRKLLESGKAHRFQKGLIPPNKGKTQSEWMTVEGAEKCKATQFRKGQRPPTAPPPGTVSIITHKKDGKPFKYIGHKLLHHIEWERLNGKIPANHVLSCRSEDTLNADPSNWDLISRVELMRRNSSVTRLPDGYIAHLLAGKRHKHLKEDFKKMPGLLELKRTLITTNRAINERKNRAAAENDAQ